MYKSVNRISVLKCLTNEGLNFSPRTSNWIQIFRKASGLKEKKAHSFINLTDDLTFTSFLRHRQEQARRSFVVRVQNQDVCQNVINLCSNFGEVKNAFHYRENIFHFLLIEMSSENELKTFLRKALKIQPGSNYCNQFLVLDEKSDIFKTNMCGEGTKTNLSERIISVATPSSKKVLNKEIFTDSNTLSEIMINCFNTLKLSDVEIRKRFLMCRQLEVLFTGLFPNAVAYPFGSSITGFGVIDCDLDIALIPLVNNENSLFLQENYLNFHKEKVRVQLAAISDVMRYFLIGCNNFFYVKHARVPVLKYRNLFTNVDCDLSLYNAHGIAISHILYSIAFSDWRIRALVIFLKLWAQKVGMVTKSPAPTLSNFSLCLLVMFFLQQIKILQPWDIFPSNDEDFLKIDNSLFISGLIKNKVECQDNKSVEDLFKLFFEYYETFDFKKWGISLRKGEVITNSENYPIYIENPIHPGVNVSGNVKNSEVMFTKELITDVVKILTTEKYNYQIKRLINMNYRKTKKIDLSQII